MKNTQRQELAVCGLESVRALAAVRPDAVKRFFYADERAREFGWLCKRLASLRRPYRLVGPDELAKLSGTAHHQGVVAMVEDSPPRPVDDALVASWAASGARIVALDRVGDDHNLGSIARSAAFFGWTAIVLGRDDGAARLSTSAYRVARGALERIPVHADETIARFVARCRGVLPVFGADHRGTMGVREARAALVGGSVRSGGPTRGLAVALGNEETGLSAPVRSACSSLVRIDGTGAVESLNVSQAAAVLLYELGPGGD
ncbi:MAG TPA: RNA methyltransferase [Spirochaetales bacterium]|nr:RNA methyltransferase [Spirochaetales bacterium]HPM74051.1 RNA methyltransferase [Spirochaetales bacterium]